MPGEILVEIPGKKFEEISGGFSKEICGLPGQLLLIFLERFLEEVLGILLGICKTFPEEFQWIRRNA